MFCLVCNKSCVRGQLDTVSCLCQCSRSAIQGRIVTSHGAPLQDASILSGSNLKTEMARTNGSGHFSMIDSCENSSYIATKNTCIPLRIEGSFESEVYPLLIHLESAGMLIKFDTSAIMLSLNSLAVFSVLFKNTAIYFAARRLSVHYTHHRRHHHQIVLLALLLTHQCILCP